MPADEIIQELIAWKSLVPLYAESTHMRPYPTQALPSIIQNAVMGYQSYGQQPLPLIACSALANVSLACQTLANVARDHLLISPISLYFLVIAASGERKSGADRAFGKAIREWERNIRQQLNPEVQLARTLHTAWSAEREAMITQIKRATTQHEETDWLKEKFVALMAGEPSIPMLPMLFFEDATQEALTSQLAEGWPSASLWSDEGSIVLNGQGMQNNTTKFIATLNRLWDGNPFTSHRKTARSVTVMHRRLTVSLMFQPLVMQQLLGRQGGISRQSGFLARSLMTYPESSMGERYYQEPSSAEETLTEFEQRLTDCLDASRSLDITGCEHIPILFFTPLAKSRWVAFFNHVEKGLMNPNQWLMIKDFASKAAENVARLSALFHLFEGKEGAIEVETLERAIQIIEWHLWETKRMLQLEQESHTQQNALRLIHWIKDKKLTQTTPRQLQQFGPIRDKRKRDDAIQYLVETHYFQEIRLNGKLTILVNPEVIKT